MGICGRNGVGKTNLLDAIHYLCFTRSYFGRLDAQNILKGHQGFRIQGKLLLNDKTEEAICILRETGKKEFTLNGLPYSRFSKHLGRYPCVTIAPDDVQLIIGNSDERRKFLDTLLSQLDHEYLHALIQYMKILQQRNSFLRNFQQSFLRDLSVLDVLDEQLNREGDIIAAKRKSFLLQFLPVVKLLYNEISQRYEDISIFYESELLQQSMTDLTAFNRQKDLAMQRTTSGIHRDDLNLQLTGLNFKSIASQGQRKSLLFALKLAEMEVLKKEKQVSPILLLDDVFEKLDDERISNLLLSVCSDEETQIFITDTDCGRLRTKLSSLGQEVQIIELK